MEKWKPIPNYPDYNISNYGRVKSLKREIHRNKKGTVSVEERFLTPIKGNIGYYTVSLYCNKKVKIYSLHRLVAKSFIPNAGDKPCINHLDGNKLNNNVLNLEWCTYAENSIHSFRNNLSISIKGENRYNAILTELLVFEIRELYDNCGYKPLLLSEMYNVSRGCICGIVYRKTWKHI